MIIKYTGPNRCKVNVLLKCDKSSNLINVQSLNFSAVQI